MSLSRAPALLRRRCLRHVSPRLPVSRVVPRLPVRTVTQAPGLYRRAVAAEGRRRGGAAREVGLGAGRESVTASRRAASSIRAPLGAAAPVAGAPRAAPPSALRPGDDRLDEPLLQRRIPEIVERSSR